MKINGHDFDFRLTNAATAERYETALREMQQRAEQAPQEGSLAEVIRGQTAMVKTFVDRLFGEGAYDTLGLDPDELDANLAVVQQIVDESGKQAQAIKARAGKYSPDKIRRGK